ncbi:hypothetical protein B0H14DRAFT_2566600 [Mycena olivaceomarginata]|nr:hypothetical protein B0H14DRAFT_2566600 [Mycena olivaceomarginata]
MAELVGLIASILQLVDTVTKATAVVKDFHNAAKEQQQIVERIKSLQPLLSALQDRAKNNGASPGIQNIKGPLLEFQAAMQKITDELLPAKARWGKLSQRVTWMVNKKKKAQEYLQEIEQFKLLCNNWLTVDIWWVFSHLSAVGYNIVILGMLGSNNRRITWELILLEVQEQHLARIQTAVNSASDVVREQQEYNAEMRRSKIIDWLSPLNFFQRQADILKTWQPGTGDWLFADHKFKDWESSSGGILWCRGIPGAGKTVLSGGNVAVTVAYLSHKETEFQTSENILSGLWRQLIVDKSLPATVHDLHKHHRERKTRPSLDEISKVWSLRLLNIQRLWRSVPRSMTLANMLMGTFHPSGYSTPFKTAQNCWLKSGLKSPTNSQGMFLLAKLHMDSLATKNSVTALRETLQHLPTDLNQTYDEAMNRIDRQSKDDRQLAHLALTWVVFAKRPFESFDPDNISDISIIVSACAGLITVDAVVSVARVIHYTTQDYLEKLDRFSNAQVDIASRCFAYASFADFASPFGWNGWQHQFLKYHEYFLVHALGQPEVCLRDIIIPFLERASSKDDFWYDHFIHNYTEGFCNSDELSPLTIAAVFNLQTIATQLITGQISATTLTMGLHGASYYGHCQMIELLIENGADVNGQGGHFGTALQAASAEGAEAIVRLLIEKGADVNVQGGKYGTALQAASWREAEAVVQLLIEKGADVNVQGGKYGSALQAASWGEAEVVFQLLIEKGADVNMQGRKYGTASQKVDVKADDKLISKRHHTSSVGSEEVAAELDADEADPDSNIWDDLDAADIDNPRDGQRKTMPNAYYMDNQPNLTWDMRATLNEWLIHSSSAPHLIDRFLSTRAISPLKLQLVGMACLLIASKVEDIVSPYIRNFIDICDGAYAAAEVIQAERHILHELEWNMSYPSPVNYLRRISKVDNYEPQKLTVAKYLAEIACVERRLIVYPPSLVAAAAMWLAHIALGEEEWTPTSCTTRCTPRTHSSPPRTTCCTTCCSPSAIRASTRSTRTREIGRARALTPPQVSVYIRQWALVRWAEGASVDLVAELADVKNEIRAQKRLRAIKAVHPAGTIGDAVLNLDADKE